MWCTQAQNSPKQNGKHFQRKTLQEVEKEVLWIWRVTLSLQKQQHIQVLLTLSPYHRHASRYISSLQASNYPSIYSSTMLLCTGEPPSLQHYQRMPNKTYTLQRASEPKASFNWGINKNDLTEGEKSNNTTKSLYTLPSPQKTTFLLVTGVTSSP